MAQNHKTKQVNINDRQQLVERNQGLEEEVKMLRQHVGAMYQAWMAGKAPPPPPPSFLYSVLTQAPSTMPDNPPRSLYIPTYPSRPSSSITRPPAKFPQRYFTPQHHSSLRDPQNHTLFSKCRTPQKAYPHQKAPGTGFRGNEAFRKERLLKRAKAITPIGEPYASLFERLKHAGQIEPLPRCTPDPHAKSFDPTARCAYHSNVEGHSIENCRSLKKEVERMIQEGTIEIKDSDRECTNPLENLSTVVDDLEVVDGLGDIDAELKG